MKPISKNVILMLGLATALLLVGMFISSAAFGQNADQVSDETDFHIVTDNPPHPKHGFEVFINLIRDSLRYPENKWHAEGSVFVKFIIEKDGSCSNFEIVKGIGPPFDAEAVRTLKAVCAPTHWVPGEVKGMVVRTKFVMPVKMIDPESKKKHKRTRQKISNTQ